MLCSNEHPIQLYGVLYRTRHDYEGYGFVMASMKFVDRYDSKSGFADAPSLIPSWNGLRLIRTTSADMSSSSTLSSQPLDRSLAGRILRQTFKPLKFFARKFVRRLEHYCSRWSPAAGA
jgi:hypothetical protein